jgi:hypothetical protein
MEGFTSPQKHPSYLHAQHGDEGVAARKCARADMPLSSSMNEGLQVRRNGPILARYTWCLREGCFMVAVTAHWEVLDRYGLVNAISSPMKRADPRSQGIGPLAMKASRVVLGL